MGKLLLVRHAQASYGAANYDQLSDHGYHQSRTLGDYLVELEMEFDHIYVGPLKRHWQTYEMVQKAYAERGKSLPEPKKMIELDEHKWPSILRRVLPELHESVPEIRRWATNDSAYPAIKKRNHLKIFHYCMDLWAAGKLEHLQPPEYPNWQT
ncbi:MAG: histidine phosphatase family protein, partial [Saprospiraceae bacterium]